MLNDDYRENESRPKGNGGGSDPGDPETGSEPPSAPDVEETDPDIPSDTGGDPAPPGGDEGMRGW